VSSATTRSLGPGSNSHTKVLPSSIPLGSDAPDSVSMGRAASASPATNTTMRVVLMGALTMGSVHFEVESPSKARVKTNLVNRAASSASTYATATAISDATARRCHSNSTPARLSNTALLHYLALAAVPQRASRRSLAASASCCPGRVCRVAGAGVRLRRRHPRNSATCWRYFAASARGRPVDLKAS
jgi:hypothetical protein